VFEPGDIVNSSEKFLEAREIIPTRLWRARPVSTPLLWVTGAALCAICLLLFTAKVDLFGSNGDAKRIAKNENSTSPPYSKAANIELIRPAPAQYDKLEPISPTAADSPHAIAVDDARSEALAVEADQATEARQFSSSPQRERVKVASAANIRSAPSASAAIIGIAHVGAEADVAARDSEWVQIMDPALSKTGWIHSKSLVPATMGTPATGREGARNEGDRSELPQEEEDAAVGLPDENTTLPTEPKPSVRSKKPRKHGWRHRHRRGMSLRFVMRRLW
jgi:hypothetical protein